MRGWQSCPRSGCCCAWTTVWTARSTWALRSSGRCGVSPSDCRLAGRRVCPRHRHWQAHATAESAWMTVVSQPRVLTRPVAATVDQSMTGRLQPSAIPRRHGHRRALGLARVCQAGIPCRACCAEVAQCRVESAARGRELARPAGPWPTRKGSGETCGATVVCNEYPFPASTPTCTPFGQALAVATLVTARSLFKPVYWGCKQHAEWWWRCVAC